MDYHIFLRSVLVLSTVACLNAAPVAFIGIGDWGGSGLGGKHATNQQDVARQMAKTAKAASIQYVVNTGDNFYYCGIRNTSDYQINLDFESVYTDDSLAVPWYSILGNHEYGYNPDAQIGYKDSKGRWVMDAHYYSKRVKLGSSASYASMFFLDTSPCVQEYRADDPSGWDPCSTQYPDCLPINEGSCDFNANILKQDCEAQLTWFTNALAAVPQGDWIFVSGHHMADEITVADFVTPMEKAGVHLYLNGHVHTLAHYSVNGRSSYVTTGAGSMVNTVDQEQHDIFEKSGGAKHEEIWSKKVAGFTLHAFSADLSQLTTTFIDSQGNSLNSFTVTRSPGPGPGPGPPGPGPGPGSASCANYGCVYSKKHACQCNPACAAHSDCCSDYASTCQAEVIVL